MLPWCMPLNLPLNTLGLIITYNVLNLESLSYRDRLLRFNNLHCGLTTSTEVKLPYTPGNSTDN